MAFDKDGLNVVSASKSGKAPKVFTYKTADPLATVDGAGYFDNGSSTNTGMRNVMSVGDLVYVYGNTDDTAEFGLMVINANTAGVIDATNATALGGTDSD
jgi:hypothetical protein